MKRISSSSVAIFATGILALASCAAEQKEPTAAEPPRAQASVTTKPGVAGGVYEDVIIVQSVVSAVDLPTRHVTLAGSSGSQFSFTAGPEIKNLPQLHVGDKVTSTFARRMVVAVRSDGAPPSASYAATGGTAPFGEKPGMLVAEETEKVAHVKAIDSVNRMADLEFADNVVKTIPVRADVDLSRYKVGDTVMIRVTTALTVLVATP